MASAPIQNANYVIIREQGFNVLKLIGKLPADKAAIFDLEVEQALSDPPQHWMVNCALLADLPQPWLKSILQLLKRLATVEKSLRLFGVSDEMEGQLKASGADRLLRTLPNLRGALQDLDCAPTVDLNVDFVNPFLKAVLAVMAVQAQTEARPGPTSKGVAQPLVGDIAGVIGIISDGFKGSMIISFPAATFLKIMSRMLGEEFKDLNNDIQDGAGELANVIFGRAKLELNERGFGIHTAIPSVICGLGHSIRTLSQSPRVLVPFESDAGSFSVEISLTPDSN